MSRHSWSREEFESVLETAFRRAYLRLKPGEHPENLLPLLRSEVAAEFLEFDLRRSGYLI